MGTIKNNTRLVLTILAKSIVDNDTNTIH